MEDNENKTAVSETEQKEADAEKKTDKKPEKKLRGRRRLFSDYQYEDVKNKNGKTVRRKVYKGKHYGYVIPSAYKNDTNAFIKRIKLTYVAFFLVLTLVWILPSLVLNSQGLGTTVFASDIEGYEPSASDLASSATAVFGAKINVQFFYVLLPYLVCALPLMLMFLTLAEFIFTPGNRHEQAFMEALSQNLRGQTITLIVSSAITVIGEIVFIILNYRVIRSAMAEVGLVIMMMALIGISIFFIRKQDSFPMEVKK